ncbi:proteasome assembly chaperone family protein [Haloarcula nitratireducens]|uniref:PAC2 family protein n=1 Tax=Haloarcula nitratireducens TaxID=2487749 RepID=A0AAW4PH58_9EURY|nr:PAC2 family protein [Halomicroarcula nitratireducens]MBX0297360.1 PAC2 family protein [Halomicroarcula nitratireducens]
MDDVSITFDQLTDIGAESPTLIEGFPGFGLVAAIAVDQITSQLDLKHHGNIVSDEFPPILSYQDGHAQDMVRVYASSQHNVMTLQSDLALPPSAFKPLSRCVLEELANEFDRAIFLAGAPAQSEDEIGTVKAITTAEELEADIQNAGIELAEGTGLVGGITGSLANDCYHHDVPAAVLVVHADPYLPDPGAARSVIEDALEPLVDFDIDTSELEEQSNQIQQQMQQIADQYQQMVEQAHHQPQSEAPQLGMYQ